MPTAKRVLVQLSCRHTWNLKGEYSIAPERYVPGWGEQLPGWGVVCAATHDLTIKKASTYRLELLRLDNIEENLIALVVPFHRWCWRVVRQVAMLAWQRAGRW